MYQQASPMGDHWHLSGIFLKPLRAWDYPNKLPFVPKRRCLLVEAVLVFPVNNTVYSLKPGFKIVYHICLETFPIYIV